MNKEETDVELAAGNGLIHRRSLLRAAPALAIGAIATTRPTESMAADGPKWMKTPGAPLSEYGTPSPFEKATVRAVIKPYGDMAAGSGVAFTPLQNLEGTITPNGLHFERSHNGVPQIDPDQHKLIIHGLVAKPLEFSVDALLRYPMTSKTCFIECAGNSFFNSNLFAETMQMPVSHLHGLISQSEWTGVRLSTLLDEAGFNKDAKWLLAEGADAAGMSRSIPVGKALDDVIVALYQNGERIRPEQGYPMRLVLPGFEGNMAVKWLRRIKVQDQPTYTKDETSKYSDLRPNGIADLFTYTMGVKSTITRPATGLEMQGPGVYEITGLAWTGHGKIAKVEISADGGASWAEAQLDSPPQPHALSRFRLLWKWDGGPATLQSLATDEKGNVQPTYKDWSSSYAPTQLNHYNALQSFRIAEGGGISNVRI